MTIQPSEFNGVYTGIQLPSETIQPIRLDKYAADKLNIQQYHLTRWRQLIYLGVELVALNEVDPGLYKGVWTYNNQTYSSYYVDSAHIGKNLIAPAISKDSNPIITTTDCGIENYLKHHGFNYLKLGDDILESAEYKIVTHFYGERRAARTGMYWMNHIDEGVAIMRHKGFSDLAISAYCLHPVLQDDDQCAKNYGWLSQVLKTVEGGVEAIVLAMEYRHTANNYLSRCKMPDTGIKLSPIPEVNQMLIADKVQNRKDFELYHLNTHPCRERLNVYFGEWLDRLGIDENEYKNLVKMIDIDSRFTFKLI